MEPPGPDINLEFSKNPLLCPICHDYYTEPCILSCYHTFCSRCLRGREQDRNLICPFCKHPTMLKDGTNLPPPDTLMRQLIDIANSENPPCSNCDKRDRSNMYYCNTCGQALCVHCRDNTHRAKMFSTHDVVHMSRCTKEPKRCLQHGEQYIMYSPLQHTMLCVNCFRDTPNEVRGQCLDIDTAHQQAAKRLERGQNAIMDLQTSVRDGIIALKGLMDELRRNMDSEKHTINTFCQGMQEAIAKTHAAMIMEVQRQFESKDRVYKSQLVVLGTVMPVLQLHLVLCTTFTSAANKYQFLELCPSLIERLAAVGNLSQPVRALQSSSIKTNYRSEFAQSLEPWIGPTAVSQHMAEIAASKKIYDAPPAPASAHPKRQQVAAAAAAALKHKVVDTCDSTFATHCRSFESQIRELSMQFNTVKERVSELHRDISAIRRAQHPPLAMRYEGLARDCARLDQSLERQQTELDRMAAVFESAWEEQVWRLRVEQEVFSCQRADVMTLRNELKHLSNVAAQLEPYIRSLTPAQLHSSSDQIAEHAQHLQNILEHIGRLQAETGKIPRSRSRLIGQLIEKVRPQSVATGSSGTVGGTSSMGGSSTLAGGSGGIAGVGAGDLRERSKSTSQAEKPLSSAATPSKPKKSLTQQQLNFERLESHIKEKIHDIMCRRQSAGGSAGGQPQQSYSKSDTEMSRDELKLSRTDLEQLARIGSKRIMYKKIGKSCDKINGSVTGAGISKELLGGLAADLGKLKYEYQRVTSDGTSKAVRAMVHETRSSPSTPRCKSKTKQFAQPHTPMKPAPHHATHHHHPQQQQYHHQQQGHHHPRPKQQKVYPYSDGEDNVFYSLHDSADSLSTSSRRSSLEDGIGGGGVVSGRTGGDGTSTGADKTLVVVINRRNKKTASSAGGMSLTQKQRSWETFPPKRKTQQYQHHHQQQHVCAKLSAPSSTGSSGGSATGAGVGGGVGGGASIALRKADSFEGHEEAVKSLVAAVQETRRKPKGGGGAGGV